MSGHSKFSNIKHKKEKADSTKGKVFTKLGREIAVAVKSGGGDPVSNGTLRDVIAKAKQSNMPNDTIDRCVKKAAGDLSNVNYEAVTYEGYGPSGVAIIVEALTDNKNRAAANIRSAFTKNGGNMGAMGCVSFLFEKKGLIMIEKQKKLSEDDIMALALESGASDFNAEEDGYEIITEPDDFTAVREAFEKKNIPAVSAEVTMLPQTYAKLDDPEDVKKLNKILDALEDDDDVNNVYNNWDGV